MFIIKEKKHARWCNLVFPSSYGLRQHKKVLDHVRGKKKDLIKKQGELGKEKGQRSIVDFALTESDNEEEGEGHDCKIPTVEYDENTCHQCQGKHGENTADCFLCKNCKGWFHENCF